MSELAILNRNTDLNEMSNEGLSALVNQALQLQLGRIGMAVKQLEDDFVKSNTETNIKIGELESELNKTKGAIEEMPSPRASYELLQKLRKTVVGNLLGGTKSPQYVLVSDKIFGNITAKVNKHFEVASYKDIPYSKMEEAKTFISTYAPHPYWVECLWKEILLANESGELSVKKQNALRVILNSNKTLMNLI